MQAGVKMKLFNRKKQASPAPYHIDIFKPVLKSSVCIGKLTVCFRDRETGKVHDIMVISHPKDLHDFGKERPVDIISNYILYYGGQFLIAYSLLFL